MNDFTIKNKFKMSISSLGLNSTSIELIHSFDLDIIKSDLLFWGIFIFFSLSNKQFSLTIGWVKNN
jgi:hypothetical protein